MICTLDYGVDSTLRLDLPEGSVVGNYPGPSGEPLDDPAEAVNLALREPLAGYPALASHVVPGDRITIALDRAVPCAALITSQIIAELVRAGADVDQITVLQAGDPRDVTELRDRLSPEVPAATVARHDPTNRGRLAYLAATESGNAVYLNRALLDADVVVSVNCAGARSAPRRYGNPSGLYPAFADEAAQQRFQSAALAAAPGSLEQREREAEEISWLVGAIFYVRVVPGPAGQLLHVVAGDRASVDREGETLYEAAWKHTVSRPGDLVIVGLSGAEQQDWDHVGRAVAVARQAACENGAIVVCSQLSVPPGESLRSLERREQAGLLERLRRRPSSEALSAYELALAMEQARVYLLSELDAGDVEELGLVPIEQPGSVRHLARQHSSIVLLGDGQFAAVAVPQEGDGRAQCRGTRLRSE